VAPAAANRQGHGKCIQASTGAPDALLVVEAHRRHVGHHYCGERADVAVAFADSQHGCTVGPNGHLMTTANGGAPLLYLRLRGLRHRAIQLGDRVAALGVVHPPLPSDGKVRLQVFRQIGGGGWAAVGVHAGRLSEDGAFRWRYRPTRRGNYGIKAHIHPTPEVAASTNWHLFSVR
jgi:hypothetical protein